MRISEVHIENFRSYRDERITLDDYTCFVGCNGAGKSTVFHALNLFFRSKDGNTDHSRLTIDDFHHKDTSKPIKITLTFTDLSPEASSELKDYVRLDQLIVSAVASYDEDSGRIEVKQFGSRMGMPQFRGFFESLKSGKPATELKETFATLRAAFPGIEAASTKDTMASALKAFEAVNSASCEPIESEDEFYGVSRGANRLSRFVQWVYVPAQKDMSLEGDESKVSALGLLLSRTVRSTVSFDEKLSELRKRTADSYQELMDAEQATLDGLSASLRSRLATWSHPNIDARVSWKQDLEKSIKIDEPYAQVAIKERGFEGALGRFGLGLQRSFLLALLQEIAFLDDETAPTLILGVEEPELYQHPPQARYLAETLSELSTKGSQILVCTHSPLFIPGDNFDKVAIVRECGSPSYTSVSRLSYDHLAVLISDSGGKVVKETGMVAKLYPSLDPVTSEMFFCRVLVLVEGYEDVAYITSHLT